MLTALAIQNAKPRDKEYKLADGDGLHLLISPNGRKHWRLRYRFGGKQLMLSLGTYPAVSLADARARRDQAQKLIADGINPSQQRKLEKLTKEIANRNTFGAIVEEHLQKQKETGISENTLEKNRWMLQKLAAPLTDRPISEINAAEVLAVLRKVEQSGRRETARKLRGAIGGIFRLAIASLRATTDPTYALRGALAAPVVTHRPAITDEADLGALMASIDDYDGWPTLRAAMQFLSLTMVRPIEVRLMRRSEVVWPKAMWRIPADRMKMRVPHEVPLSKQALEVLRSVWDLSREDRYIFPSIRSPLKPLSESAINSALRRMGYTKEEVCAHGFRSSASTILNERGFDRDVIEAALAHQDTDEVRAAYNRSKYWKPRIKLMQAWADLLDEFKSALGRTNSTRSP
jgi:integrase